MAEHDNASWLDFAGPVADDLIRLFADPADGGFFTTGHDAERLVVRQKDVFDNATPSANSLAANALLRFAALSGDRRYEEPAVRVLTMLGRVMSAHPTSFAHALAAAERSITRPLEVAIVGPRRRSRGPRRSCTRCRTGSSRTRCCSSRNRARARARRCSPTARCSTVSRRRTCASGYACRQPVTSPAALRTQLDAALGERQRATT